jgi:hypothetical protein
LSREGGVEKERGEAPLSFPQSSGGKLKRLRRFLEFLLAPPRAEFKRAIALFLFISPSPWQGEGD